MSQELDQQDIAKRYLLGELSEEERERFEEQYFFDDTEFEQLEMAEDELIEKYVRGELSAEEKGRFEQLLVSPGITERVEVARLIARTVPAKQVVTTPAFVPVKPVGVGWWERLFGPAAAIPAFRPAFAMSLIFMLLTTVGLVFVWMKLRTESQRLAQEQQQRELLQRQNQEQIARFNELSGKLDKTEKEKEELTALTAELQRLLEEEKQRSAAAMILPVILNAGSGSRGPGGEGPKDLSIANHISQVVFTLNVTHGEGLYQRYNAVVRRIDPDTPIKSGTNLKPVSSGSRRYIRINVNAKDLRPGSYHIDVAGITPDGKVEDFDDYVFRVKER